ncbi:MAG: hypothetical protein HY841_14440 [Bacteroidetes bacterium]|nr:hypothetical protein [Bacteroidota bacterium]
MATEILTGEFKRSCTKKNGKTLFIYWIKGSYALLRDYKASRGDYLTVDPDGKNDIPLFPTYYYCGKVIRLKKSMKGNYFAFDENLEAPFKIKEICIFVKNYFYDEATNY